MTKSEVEGDRADLEEHIYRDTDKIPLRAETIDGRLAMTQLHMCSKKVYIVTGNRIIRSFFRE